MLIDLTITNSDTVSMDLTNFGSNYFGLASLFHVEHGILNTLIRPCVAVVSGQPIVIRNVRSYNEADKSLLEAST